MRINFLLYKTFLAGSIIALASCGGDDTLLTPYVPEDSGPFTYEIKGLRDTSMEKDRGNTIHDSCGEAIWKI